MHYPRSTAAVGVIDADTFRFAVFDIVEYISRNLCESRAMLAGSNNTVIESIVGDHHSAPHINLRLPYFIAG